MASRFSNPRFTLNTELSDRREGSSSRRKNALNKQTPPLQLKVLSHESIFSEADWSLADEKTQKKEAIEDRGIKAVQYKDSLVLNWCIIVAVFSTLSALISLPRLEMLSPFGKSLAIVSVLLSVLADGALFSHSRSPASWKLHMILVCCALLQIRACAFFIFQGELMYKNPDDPSNAFNLEHLSKLFPMQIGQFFQQNLLFLERIQGSQSRKLFVLQLYVQIFIINVFVLIQAIFDTSWKTIFSIFGLYTFIYIIYGTVFTYFIYKLQTAKQDIIDIEREETLKYKTMFNLLQDPILLIEDGAISFKNEPARQLIPKAHYPRFETLPLDDPLFHLVKPCSSSSGPTKDRYSLKDLLEHPEDELSSLTFSNSKHIARATQMDQVQRILEEQGDRSTVSFFQIKVIKVNPGRRQAGAMVQVQDVSLRIQSQFLHMERQYMSIMNSTVSHEMRNPLNAIVSQIDRQRGNLLAMSEFVARSFSPSKSQAEQLASIEQDLKASLNVSESSTNLIRFNVEDILALPQLKAGKFTKNLHEVDLKKGVQEVIDIMQHQADAKQIQVRPQFEGFPLAENNAIVLEMDLQRFQQVLLNFLSNALKFTFRRGKIKIMLQMVRAATSRELIVGLPQKDAEAETVLQGELDRFYGSDYLDDEVSDSDGEESSESDSEQASLKTHLSRADKFAFRARQREVLKAALVKERRPKILLSVFDTGLGIKVVDQMKLFKLFGRLKSNQKVNTRGVGLGLSITKMISEEFGGTALVHSKWRKGSVFQASFSLVGEATNLVKKSQGEEVLATKLALIKQRQSQKICKHLRMAENNLPLPAEGKRVLVVDDEVYNTEVLRVILTSLGVPPKNIVCCLSGSEALKELRSSLSEGQEADFALIFTDLSMPIMDGYRFTYKARKAYTKKGICREQQPMIIALTGHTESEYYLEALEKGVDFVYPKPVSTETIRLCLLESGFRTI